MGDITYTYYIWKGILLVFLLLSGWGEEECNIMSLQDRVEGVLGCHDDIVIRIGHG